MEDLIWQCPSCRCPSATKSAVCEHCGKPRPPQAEGKPTRARGYGWVALMVMGWLLIVGVLLAALLPLPHVSYFAQPVEVLIAGQRTIIGGQLLMLAVLGGLSLGVAAVLRRLDALGSPPSS